jgi:serine/threonine protein phosphatase PrpC
MAKRRQWIKTAEEVQDGQEDVEEQESLKMDATCHHMTFATTTCHHNVTSAQLAGHDGGTSSSHENQDACIVSKLENGALLLGVMDGHDDNGGTIARTIQRELPRRLELKLHQHSSCCSSSSSSDEDIRTALRESYWEIHQAVSSNTSLVGGSTASVVIQMGTKLIVASAGDSSALVMAVVHPFTHNNMNHDDDNVDNGANFTIVHESQPDRPTLPDERARIENMGGKVSSCGRVMYKDINNNNNKKNNCSWKPGVAMSRSIGDCDMIGVIATPSVHVFDVQQLLLADDDDDATDCFLLLLLATDGMMDCISPTKLATTLGGVFCNNNDNDMTDSVQGVLQDLMRQAANVWKHKTSASYRDDMTIVVCKTTKLLHS